jgi:hypothetical protein
VHVVKKKTAKVKKPAKKVAKASPARKVAKASPARKAAKAAPAKKVAKAAPAKKATKATRPGAGVHPHFARLTSGLRPGRHADGLLLVTQPGALDAEMSGWLMGQTAGRRSIGRTAFGDFVVFRDLRDRAREAGQPDAETACDIAMIDIHDKAMAVLADSVEGLLAAIDRHDWQEAFLRRSLYRDAKPRIGDFADDECFGFVPALAIGGSGDAESVERMNWRVHQELLRQL